MEANVAVRTEEATQRWIAVEHRLMERCRNLTWWQAARLAAAHERVLPALAAQGLRVWTVRTATSGKQEYLEAAHNRLRKTIKRDMWSGSAEGPPDGIDDLSVAEVRDAVSDMACNALTATVLDEEMERGLVSPRRREQLAFSAERLAPESDDQDEPAASTEEGGGDSGD